MFEKKPVSQSTVNNLGGCLIIFFRYFVSSNINENFLFFSSILFLEELYFMVLLKMDWSSVSQPNATDNLTAALKSNILPNQEYLLQGSVLDSSVEVLLQRLRGLCDNVDTGPEPFHDHEMCFSIMNVEGGTNPQSLSLRVRRALDYQDMPWQLRYIGQPEGSGDKSRPTIVRSSIDIGTSATVVDFLTEMGCRLDFEYISRGYMFRKGRMKITVSKIFKMGLGQGKPSEGMEALSQSYLVELSVLAPTGQDAIAEDMKNFAEQLRPLVMLEKVDYKQGCHMYLTKM